MTYGRISGCVRQNLRVIEYRTPAEIEQMRPAGRFVAEVLSALIARVDVGVNLLELDELAHQMIRDRGAESCYINYHPSFGASPFGKVLCTSVDDAVLHGLPHDYELVDGDLLSLDFAASLTPGKLVWIDGALRAAETDNGPTAVQSSPVQRTSSTTSTSLQDVRFSGRHPAAPGSCVWTRTIDGPSPPGSL